MMGQRRQNNRPRRAPQVAADKAIGCVGVIVDMVRSP
jgi:hypothetical protein